LLRRLILIIFLSLGLFFLGRKIGLTPNQAIAIAIFSASIFGTLFFWSFRLTFAFLGTSFLLITQTIDIDNFIRFSSLEVILFLIGMMVLVGFLKDMGFFAWFVSLILHIKNFNADKFLILISIISALLACMVDEVTSIIFVVAAIFEICDHFEINPTPFLIISVLATNIGSSGTALGNPIGILIAAKSGLSFEDFIIRAFPVMLASLVFFIVVARIWYRKYLSDFNEKIRESSEDKTLIRLISVPPGKNLRLSLIIFSITLLFIALHRRLELLWGLNANTFLLTMPLISSGGIMAWKWKKAREYIEKDVEWWTLLFFILLFAQAGTLKYTGATDVLADKLIRLIGHNPLVITSALLWISAVGSSILDNVVLVASFIPVIQSLNLLGIAHQSFWWALLFGGCFGGNITLVGSTANIVALGILEKEKNIRITFFRWFGIGLVIGIITTVIAWVVLLTLPIYYR